MRLQSLVVAVLASLGALGAQERRPDEVAPPPRIDAVAEAVDGMLAGLVF